jgi:prevent-host-death family protein
MVQNYALYTIGYCSGVEHSISATELARRLGDVLGRVRYRGDSFLVERKGVPVARVIPAPGAVATPVREALAGWRAAGEADTAFADDLDRIGAADRAPEDAWAS